MALIVCPKCRNQFQGPTGTRVKCPHCGIQLETPPSQQQTKQREQESGKKRRWIVTAVVVALVLLGSYLIWDIATFTEKEYNDERAQLLEKIDYYMGETANYLAKKSLAEIDYKLADSQYQRDNAYDDMERANRQYIISKDMLESSEQELDDLQEKYESGIWYKLFG